MSVWDDFKIVDGVKLYKGECSICGRDFWDRNPYRKNCEDRQEHARLRKEKVQRKRWGTFHCAAKNSLSDGWSGSWDNAVSITER